MNVPPPLPHMKQETAQSPLLTMRWGVLLAIAVSLLIPLLTYSGYYDVVSARFASGNVVFMVCVLVETLLVFSILYCTPLLFSQRVGRWSQAGRVVGLVVLAHCFVWGTMMGVAIVWFVVCAIFGIQPRDV